MLHAVRFAVRGGNQLAFVLPLVVDSFAVAAALGASGLTGIGERLRVSLIFVVFEAGMPPAGLGAGAGLARAIGGRLTTSLVPL